MLLTKKLFLFLLFNIYLSVKYDQTHCYPVLVLSALVQAFFFQNSPFKQWYPIYSLKHNTPLYRGYVSVFVYRLFHENLSQQK